MAKASGHAKPKKAGKRKVSEIHIKHANNGFIVHHEKEPQKKMTRGSMTNAYEPPEQNVFQDHGQAAAHVAGLMQQMPDNDGDEGGAPGGAPPMAA